MYEPYGEEKKGYNCKEKFNQLKQKIKEKFKNLNIKGIDTENLKFDKVTVTAVALTLLLFVGGITGFISYTGKINTLQTDNLVLQKQNDGLQVQLNDANQQISTCSSNLEASKTELETTKDQLAKTTLNYQATSADLQACNNEKLTLSSDLNLVGEDLKRKKDEYSKLEDKYDNLENNLEDLECSYAKERCRKYYFIEDNEVFCCVKNDPGYCDEDPDGAEIKEINC